MRKKHSHMPELLLILLGLILIGTALYHILPDYLDNKKSADTYQTLEEKYLEAKEAGTEADTRELKKDWWATDVTVAFDALKKENEEIIGWLRFDDADDLHISYPVLYSGDDEKYLRSDIYGEEHIAGSMFGDLDLYKETGFWKNHQYFTLYTENMAYRYQIFSSQMASMSGKVFRIGYIPGKEYEDFIDEMVQDSLIETGLHPESNRRILTDSFKTYLFRTFTDTKSEFHHKSK